MAIRPTVCEAPSYTPMGENNGTLRAYIRVPVTDFNGVTRLRRVTIGREWHIGLERAKKLMQNARANNANIDQDDLVGTYTVSL